VADDPRFATNADRVAHRAELVPILRDRFAELDSGWWRGRLAGVPNATSLVLDDLMRGTGAELVRQFVAEVPHPRSGTMRVVRPPWQFERTPASQSGPPVPGQHNVEFVIRPAGDAPADVVRDRRPTDSENLAMPLSRVRVVELAQGISGPYCGWLMAALGADVTKVEADGGDYVRNWTPTDKAGDSGLFRALNRGKRSVVHSAAVVAELVRDADVVLTDGSLGDVEAGERTVVCEITPTGDGSVATELEVQALAGLTRYIGAIGDAPVRVGADLATTLAGSFGLQAVLAALLERQTSGLGQRVAVSALGSTLAVLSVMVAALDDPEEWGGFHCLAAAYPRDHGVTTSDGAISFSSPRRQDDAWIALCHELGADPLADDPRFATDALRTPRSKELNRELAQYTARLPTATVLAATHRHGGLGVPIQNYEQFFQHPQAQAMDLLDTSAGYTSLAAPWRIDGKRPHVTGRSPHLGEHER
jgi:crotonobetainyl-CoA:carnitine CoA-transferase CaiB-like acyl-CoA transferase